MKSALQLKRHIVWVHTQRWPDWGGERMNAWSGLKQILAVIALCALSAGRCIAVPDAYEVDDSSALATSFPFPAEGTQQHNFHSAQDEDWVKFYAPTGLIFNIEATQLGPNSDLALELYYEQPDGTLASVETIDNYGPGVDVTERLMVDLKTGMSGLLPGVYYVRVSSADTNLFGPGSEYALQIYVPIGDELILNVRVFLQGPYDVASHSMLVGNPASIPTTSPFAADPRRVWTIPSNVVDWVLVELSDTNGSAMVTKIAFLDTQGQLLSASGSNWITAGVSTGYYSIVIKTRNHLAVMSSQPVAITNYHTNYYDFTTGADKYGGGTNAAVQLEPDVWGMVAGDADGDGEILAVDGSVCTNQLEQTGYFRADFNLDGIVSTNDFALWMANQGRTTYAANGKTILSPGLTVSPGRKTLLAGASQVFVATGNAEPVTWAMVKNPSGGTLTSSNANSAIYTAGSSVVRRKYYNI